MMMMMMMMMMITLPKFNMEPKNDGSKYRLQGSDLQGPWQLGMGSWLRGGGDLISHNP